MRSDRSAMAKQSRRHQRSPTLPRWVTAVDIKTLSCLHDVAGEYVRLIRAPGHRSLGGLLFEAESEEEYQLREQLRRAKLADEFDAVLANDSAHQALLRDTNYCAILDSLKRHAADAGARSPLNRTEAKAELIAAIAWAALVLVIDSRAIREGFRLTPTLEVLASVRHHCVEIVRFSSKGLYAVPAYLPLYQTAKDFKDATTYPATGQRARAEKKSLHQPKQTAHKRFDKDLRAAFTSARKFREVALNHFRAFVGYRNRYAVSR